MCPQNASIKFFVTDGITNIVICHPYIPATICSQKKKKNDEKNEKRKKEVLYMCMML